MSEAEPSGAEHGVVVTEVRVLEGPNLYFTRPAIKVSLRLQVFLDADAASVNALARTLHLRRGDAGEPLSETRQRFVMRVVERVLRLLAKETGTTRLGVRVRPGSSPEDVVVAFPWKSRGRSRVLAEQLEPLLRQLIDGSFGPESITASAQVVLAEPVGEPPQLPRPKVPVISITGTNGKTTTTRLIAHIGMTAGMRTGWSSTDGVLMQGELIEYGDYSGPSGARTVLESPGVELAVLETARGGLLLRGMGVPSNDVSVVTNVTADHLGVQGIDTVDQLAEVKAIITKITKPDGWVVLNGDDPRVWAMRNGISGRPWVFSLSADSPALREAVQMHGRGITVLDGDIVVISPGRGPERLVSVLDVPMTFAGLSEHNVANALAGAAGALGLGIPWDAVVDGLRTFAPDPTHNPGRMNVYSLPLESGGQATVILDMAHNEGGLDALLKVAEGLRLPGALINLGLGTGGDRTDEILVNLGEMAGLRADRVQVVHKEYYLRGRSMADLEALLREGLSRAGANPTHSWENELLGLQGLAETARDGDVIAVMTHSDREVLHSWIMERGGTVDDARAIRLKVVEARGEHELEQEITAIWADDDERRRIDTASTLVQAHPGDARLLFELAGTHDAAGAEDAALGVYDDALASGLREPYRHRALIQKASTLRHLGRYGESLTILDDLLANRPGDASITVFRALVLHEMGRGTEALQDALGSLLKHAGDSDVELYRGALTRFVAQLDQRADQSLGVSGS